MDELLSNRLLDLRSRAETVVDAVIAPQAEITDRDCRWPDAGLRALAEVGLLGLHVPQRLGGCGEGLLALVVLTETLGKACPSTAMCFGMHCVGTAVIAAKATPDQEERYLRPIAAGRHVTTLALSESGTGVHFYMPQTKLEQQGELFFVSGNKQFITNGGHADSYVLSTQASHDVPEQGEFSCLIVDKDTPNLQWQAPWAGVGMRGNSSRGLALQQAPVPVANLLGQEGDQIWYVFEVVAPYFLMAMAGTYLGIAEAALGYAIAHLRTRRYQHSGETLADAPVLQHQLSEMWLQVSMARAHIYQAARLGDIGNAAAMVSILTAKVAAAEAAVRVCNDAMTLCGGQAYRDNSVLARQLRDARAAHVMAPTTNLLKLWAGRQLLDLPIL